MVRKGNLAVFEGNNISETEETTPTKIGVHPCDINPYWHEFFPAGARSAPAGPKIVLVPPRSILYIYLSALEDHHAVYTRCIGRMHSLATTSGPARKVGVV